jgi:hypothetical protein
VAVDARPLGRLPDLPEHVGPRHRHERLPRARLQRLPAVARPQLRPARVLRAVPGDAPRVRVAAARGRGDLLLLRAPGRQARARPRRRAVGGPPVPGERDARPGDGGRRVVDRRARRVHAPRRRACDAHRQGHPHRLRLRGAVALARGVEEGQAGRGEVFDYPGGYTAPDDGTRYARVRLEEAESGARDGDGGERRGTADGRPHGGRRRAAGRVVPAHRARTRRTRAATGPATAEAFVLREPLHRGGASVAVAARRAARRARACAARRARSSSARRARRSGPTRRGA